MTHPEKAPGRERKDAGTAAGPIAKNRTAASRTAEETGTG